MLIRHFVSLLSSLCLLVAPVFANSFGGNPVSAAQFSGEKSPLLFMENRGQVTDLDGSPRPDILFLGKAGGLKIAIGADGIHYQFEQIDNLPTSETGAKLSLNDPSSFKPLDVSTYRLDMHLVGANPNPEVVSEQQNPYFENYHNIPSHPDGVLGVRAFEKITLRNVYPGIDWVIYSRESEMKYDFIVHPGADYAQIQIRYEGALGMEVDEEGGLTVKSPLGEITEDAPVTFANGKTVASRFVLRDGMLSFAVDAFDPSSELVIDPSIIWATYYGGTNTDWATSTVLDASGNPYMAGYTVSTTNVSSGGFQNGYGGGTYDAFLVKFNAAGVRQWATYYGDQFLDMAREIVLDGSGNIYMSGYTASTANIASGGFQNTFGSGSYDAMLVKFNSTGGRIWATYFGDVGDDVGNATAVDASGNVYLAGTTTCCVPVVGGHQTTFGGYRDAFLVKFNSAGSRLWGTYYGGNYNESCYDVATDPNGNVYLTGSTTASSGIAFNGYDMFLEGSTDLYLVKFNSSGTRIWGTYYGGEGDEDGGSLAIDASSNVYLAGWTGSYTNVASGGAHQGTFGQGSFDAFLVRFDASGPRVWATYYGGTNWEIEPGCAVDASGNVYLTGWTQSTTNIGSGGFQNTLTGGSDGFLALFNASGVRQWGTYCGGNLTDRAFSAACGPSGVVYIAGATGSTTGLALNGHQNTNGGGTWDAMLMKIQGTAANTAPIAVCQNVSVTANANCQGTATATQFNNGSSDPEGDPLTFSTSPSGPYSLGLTNVVLSVSDGQGHTTTCAATITVTDATVPTITCPANVSVSNGVSVCNAVVTYTTPVGADNCGGASTTQTAGLASGATFPVGVTTNTFRVTDGAGNSATCAFTVTVTDTQIPTISCPANISVGSSPNVCNAVVSYTVPVGADNCAGSTTTQTTGLASGATFPVGVTSNAFTVSDNSGNSASCSFSVTVTDNTPPTANCMAITVNLDANGNGSTTANAVNNGSSDNCGIASLTLSMTTFTCANAGANNVTLTVTDVNGNSSSCATVVTVVGQAITASAQADVTTCNYNVSCSGGNDGVAHATVSGGCPP